MPGLPRLARGFETVAYWAAVLSLLVVTCAMVAQVVFRYALAMPLQWPETVSVYALVWVVFLGSGALAFQEGGHVSIPWLTDKLPAPMRAVVTVLGRVAVLVFVGVVLWVSFHWLTRGSHQMSAALGVSTLWVKLALPVGIGFLGLATLVRLSEDLPALLRRDWARFPPAFDKTD